MAPRKEAQKCSEGNTGPLSTKDSSFRARLFCFTSFGEQEPMFDEDRMRYMGYSRETCPTTKKLHWQSFVYFKNPTTVVGARKQIKEACNIACSTKVCNGSLKQNEAYCSKSATMTHHGQRPEQGKRTDLDSLRDMILAGTKTCKEIAKEEPHTFHQYGRTLHYLEDIAATEKRRETMTTCEWLHGKAGAGKSRFAFENETYKDTFVWTDDNGWWDGYTGQKTVIINDFRGEIKFNQLMQLIDRYTYKVRRRNREPVPFTSTHVIITSPMPPHDVYKDHLEEDWAQFTRRITVTEMLGDVD